MSKLVIVESPKKAKTIAGKLDSSFKVISTKGHIKDLPKKRIGIDVNNNFECEWVAVPGKEKLINEIIRKARSATQVLLASDPDREGEAISYHIFEILKEINPNIKRIVFNEITQKAIINAVKSPRDIDIRLFESQKARRILDRLVGFLLSPLLIYFLKRNLSAGRVQSVALKLIVDQERSVLAFIPEEYWRVFGLFRHAKGNIECELKKINGNKPVIDTAEKAERLVQEVKNASFSVSDIIQNTIKKTPPEPFKTSTLQQEANIRFGFSGKRTMMIAQGLYEGKTIGKEEIGLITYMRTDSVRVSDEAKNEALRYIQEKLGLKAQIHKPGQKSRGIKIQDAHEAIRPSDPYLSPDTISRYLSRDEYRVYDLIWRRFIASYLDNAVYDKLSVYIDGDKKYIFEADFLKLSNEGFLSIYRPVSMIKTAESVPGLKKGEKIELDSIRPEQHFTEPPKRYTEASLIKALEKQGIGRPSTYATILDTLKKREYIKLDKKTILPLFIGFFVSSILDEYFSDIINVHFTAEMEDKLDRIEQGKVDWIDMMGNFYRLLHKSVNNAKKELQKGISTDIKCPACGKNMAIRFSSKGEYLSCTNYPYCKTRKNLGHDEKFNIIIEEEGDISKKCPECGKTLVLKTGKYGKFYGCSGFPECRYTEPLEKPPKHGLSLEMIPESYRYCKKCKSPLKIVGGNFSNYMVCENPDCRDKYQVRTGIKCPDESCGGELIEKHNKKEKPYYACSNYPKCRITVPYMPVDKKCPKCGYGVMYRNETKDRITFTCANKECKHRETVRKEDNPPNK